ncbi:hypothetical protein [Mesonia sp. K7]|uniref:hypothetical protein n=1 Tax=Mesonia sp. K7 TaxID=2218606 RepID=UPI000DA96AF6|nr:hypothetical protein [Mesonia sp. K7]PZD79016.1 hypothetical protein DNG35_03140 [Mesonia sp. K7]
MIINKYFIILFLGTILQSCDSLKNTDKDVFMVKSYDSSIIKEYKYNDTILVLFDLNDSKNYIRDYIARVDEDNLIKVKSFHLRGKESEIILNHLKKQKKLTENSDRVEYIIVPSPYDELTFSDISIFGENIPILGEKKLEEITATDFFYNFKTKKIYVIVPQENNFFKAYGVGVGLNDVITRE